MFAQVFIHELEIVEFLAKRSIRYTNTDYMEAKPQQVFDVYTVSTQVHWENDLLLCFRIGDLEIKSNWIPSAILTPV